MNSDDIQKLLDKLSTALTPAASNVWDVVVRQQIIEALAWLGVGIVLFFVAIALTIGIRIWRNAACYFTDDDTSLQFTGVFVIWFVWFFGLGAWLVTDLPKLINPQYGALMDLLDKLTGH